jgi:prephenate dehydrogenase
MTETSLQSGMRVAVLGPGLLGGSVLLALRSGFPGVELRAWARRQAVLDAVMARGLADGASTDLAEVVAGADLVVLATPVETMAGLAAQLAAVPVVAGTAAVVTDVGSVKGALVGELEGLLAGSGWRFVGSHPMAGSERAGLEAARADLFAGAVCLVTPTPQSDAAAVVWVQDFWRSLGCEVLELSPQQHDLEVARVSHLPHLLAAVSVLAALRGDPGRRRCVGRGFRDSTRVAAGDAGLWTGIVRENATEVLAALLDARAALDELILKVEENDDVGLRAFLSEAKELRELVNGADK